ncbi:MAG: patatin-like phospholipase family protein [Abyssibacter sp.]|uniref:patatin-like phospholipase family protein n=1 Tax=Abyssibacter sp. TaxID=2320200 RepID=UPI002EAE974E|nr:patatin-like phospholipase family protein [Pseudomonadota bacterium]
MSEQPGKPSGAPTLGDWLALAPFGLTLSSGFFGFFAHAGVVQALAERGLRPAQVSGSSAGALIGASWAAGLSPPAIAERLLTLDKADFWDPFPGAGLIRGKRFERLLEHWLPVQRFEDCRIPLALSVYDVFARRTRVLTTGRLARAIRASCAVPLMFHPVWIGGRPYLDGGVRDRPGLEGMDQSRVLYHHLASRSPWRATDGAHTIIPKRPGLIALILDDLPRAGPDALDRGVEAYHLALALTRDALNRPAPAHVLRVGA